MIGSAIRAIRKQCGIGSSELARMIGISQSYMSRIENNNRMPSIGILAAIDRIAADRGIPSNLVSISDVNDETARSVHVFMNRDDISGLRKRSVRAVIELAMKAE